MERRQAGAKAALSVPNDDFEEAVLHRLQLWFSDIPSFDKQIAPNLREVIRTSGSFDYTARSVHKVAVKYFDVDQLIANGETEAVKQIDFILEVCYTTILSMREEYKHEQWTTTSKLLEKYPDFWGCDPSELRRLLEFRNAVAMALKLIPAHRNKARLLKVGARMEGCQKEYVTGSGQSVEVSRRVKIYEQEGGEEAQKREPRDRPRKRDSEHPESSGETTTTPAKRGRPPKSGIDNRLEDLVESELLTSFAAPVLNTAALEQVGYPAPAPAGGGVITYLNDVFAPYTVAPANLSATDNAALPALSALPPLPPAPSSSSSSSTFPPAPLPALPMRTLLPVSSWADSFAQSSFAAPLGPPLRGNLAGVPARMATRGAFECSFGTYQAQDLLVEDWQGVRLQLQN